MISEKLTTDNIQYLLSELGINFDSKRPDGDGWISIKSPLRDDKHPSFGLNPNRGAWKDHGTGASGDIVNLVQQIKNLDQRSAIKWIKDRVELPTLEHRPTPSKTTSDKSEEQNKFWTNARRKKLKKAKKRLQKEKGHSIVKQAQDYDQVKHETLLAFGCGVMSESGKDWLAFPYTTGCQLYRREQNKKVIRCLKGSSPNDSFFGTEHLEENNQTLYIAKSPRECMLLWQIYGEFADVIGLATGEQEHISDRQREWLQSRITEHYQHIYVFLDCDTTEAYQTAKGFARKLKDICEESEIYLVNIYESTADTYKDVTDCLIDGMNQEDLEGFLADAEKISAKTAKKAKKATCHSLDPQLDISRAPSIPDEVYKLIPRLLRDQTSLIGTRRRRDVFLVASLPALAAQMPNVWAPHRDGYYAPHLFIQIIAGPGTGKGEAGRARILATATDRKIRTRAEQEIEEYESRPDEEKTTETSPKMRSLLIPANASSRKMYDRIEANGGNGLIFETEVDTLINATKQEWGDYTDLVRKAFHHEPISIIRTDNEFYVQNPRLSICLTGTFDQFKTMFKSAENGHFSRYGFYTFNITRDWQSHKPTNHTKSLHASMKVAGERLYKMYRRLAQRDQPLYINLEDWHWHHIDQTFGQKMQIIDDLGLSDHLHASNNRAAVLALRMASVFSVLRTFEEKPNKLTKQNSLTPSKEDMEAALKLADMFIKHAIRLFYVLPKSQHEGQKGGRYDKFVSKLPQKFTTAEATDIGDQLDVPERTIRYWLKKEDEFKRVKHGHYQKRQ